MVKAGALLLVCMAFFSCIAWGFEAKAPAAILIEARTARILYAKNANLRREPASTTKILTALIAVENVKDLNAPVTISVKAASTEGSSAGLKPGMKVPLRELLYSMLMLSGNDAAVAIAEHVAGNVPAFATLMNTRARAAGANGSNFVNPSGLPDKLQYTTVHDLALIGRAAMRSEVLAGIVATKEHRFSWMDNPVTNHNRLLWMVQGADGIKNGYTISAKHTWIGSASRDGLRLITAVLGADSRTIVLDDQKAMLEYGFSLYKQHSAISSGAVVGQLRVRGGEIPEVAVVAGKEATVWVPRDQVVNVDKQINLPDQVRAPLVGNEQLGTLRYVVGEEVLAEVPLVPASPVDPLPALTKVGRYVKWGGVGAVGTFGLAFAVRTVNFTRRRLKSLRRRRRARSQWRMERRSARLRRMNDYY